MAENKSFYRKAVDYLQAPPQRRLQEKAFLQNSSVDSQVFGYNTQSGFMPDKLLKEIGDGTGNSAVVACLNVLTTSFAEPRLKVYRETSENDFEVLDNHPVTQLINRPNPYTSGSLLASYVITALNAEGNAYLLKNRNKSGRVIELVPLIPHYVKPRGNEKELITHYEYYVKDPNSINANEFTVLPASEVVHIRQGIDPNNHRKGFAPLKAVLREILGDEAAGQYAAALLHNMAVPGVILSPKDDAMGGPSQDEAEAIAQIYKQKFGGSNRGAPMILSGSMDVKVVSWSPEQLNLNQLRRLPEERVSAVLGVPAILAGLGAGLEAATYNNTRELREFFTEQKLIPLWQVVSNEITAQLLQADYTNDNKVVCKYDLGEVRALDVDKGEMFKRMQTGVSGGWITVAEARKAVGLEYGDEHEVFLRPLNLEPTKKEDYLKSPDDEPEIDTGDERDPDNDESDVMVESSANFEMEEKTLSTQTMPVEITREGDIVLTPSYLDEEKAPISEKVKKTLQKKVTEHNSKNPKFKANYRMLSAVFRRGVGAYRTNPASVRGNVTGATQWGIARVNAFLKGLKGSFPRKPFDLDLLPAGHPKSSKSTDMIDELKVSLEEAETLHERNFEVEAENSKADSVKVGDAVSWSINKDPDPPSTVHGVVTSVKDKEATMMVWAIMEDGSHQKTDRSVTKLISSLRIIADFRNNDKAPKDLTNFPNAGDNQKISLSNSDFRQFPDYAYIKNLKENYPKIWRRAGNGGNPPTSFTGNDAFRNWTKYKAGDRSASVLSWVKRREAFMSRHQGNTRLNGTIAVMKWGGVTKSGVSAMKKIVNEQKKKDDARKKKAEQIVDQSVKLNSTDN